MRKGKRSYALSHIDNRRIVDDKEGIGAALCDTVKVASISAGPLDRLSLSSAWLAPLNRGSLNSAHIHGTDVPVEEPSTASEADMAQRHSIISSALASSVGGTVRPSVLAVLRLITK